MEEDHEWFMWVFELCHEMCLETEIENAWLYSFGYNTLDHDYLFY